MTDLNARIERAKKEVSGNESLLEMLETGAATELFNWGSSLAAAIARDTEGMDDATADTSMAPRLKALRQAVRSMGNWAAGKYSDPADRLQLKSKLLEQFKLILGESMELPADNLNTVIDSVDVPGSTPHSLLLKLKELIEKTG